ncbi:centrosomal protein of 85 kDa-like, partial [Notothenia coriiceps]|uniref:Centrosomal protein of 85 kDa-like n=1 Tax=Notothenia coriiceps TaxID=8208 RepID=A0A6I9PQR0_9TELE
QKQQILQLHARIRENELRAEQVLHSQRVWLDDPPFQKESALRTCKQPSDRLYCDEELGRKLAVAELEVLHLSEFFKQVNHKYTEDIRKLEEKIKTRDRYISSLKKKCQRESEQIREKQQRIETLEKYLSDLPTLDEVQTQSQQQEEVQQKAKHLERTASRLQQSLEEGYALMKEKDIRMEMQTMREKELIASVQRNKRAFIAQDTVGAKNVQKELKKELRAAKEKYKDQLEGRLEVNNSREVWGGTRKITGFTSLIITTGQVRNQLSKINVRKARGPENTNLRVLKACAGQLAGAFEHLFSLSLKLMKVPDIWKTSCIVPVPKKTRPSTPGDYRSVALTLHVMKIFERLILQHLKPLVCDSMDPLQFAFQEIIGVEQ